MLSSAGVFPLSCLDYNGSFVFIFPTQLVAQLGESLGSGERLCFAYEIDLTF